MGVFIAHFLRPVAHKVHLLYYLFFCGEVYVLHNLLLSVGTFTEIKMQEAYVTDIIHLTQQICMTVIKEFCL